MGTENREPGRPVSCRDSALVAQRRRVLGLKLRDGRHLLAGATIITTGTFLNGLIHCGEERYPAGRSGEPASVLLGEALRALGPAHLPPQDRNAAAARRPHHPLGGL